LTFYLVVDSIGDMKTPANFEQILTVAETLIQTKGYNAFSYRDIAEQVGIKTSSIHYHFPTKADLGKTLVKKHLDTLAADLRPILDEEKFSSHKKLELLIDGLVARTYLDQEKMCLGGMLASEVLTLPESIKKEVQQFFIRIEGWIQQLLRQGVERKEFKFEKKELAKEASFILSLFEGSLLLARLFQDEGYLTTARRQIMARLN
jgi:TetR/AcrR family transcriptional repressor of nem operon